MLLGGAPHGGWFGYAPLTTGEGFLPGPNRLDFYALGLQILGVASLVGVINLIVTILNMRASCHEPDGGKSRRIRACH